MLSDSAEDMPREETLVSSVNDIPVEQIEVNPFQPRQNFDEEALSELADSIRVHGIIQPITVRKMTEGQYQLISGERRLQASKKAGLELIPAFVRTANDQQMLEMALIENIQRENLNPIEIALSYNRLMTECSLKQEELGERVGKNRSTVANFLGLLRLPPDIQAALREEEITMGHAKALLGIDNPIKQMGLFKKTVNEKLSVRKVEELAREIKLGSSKPEPKKPNVDADVAFQLKQIQSKLASHFGAQVKIQANDAEKGEIKIPYESVSDLNRILELINL